MTPGVVLDAIVRIEAQGNEDAPDGNSLTHEAMSLSLPLQWRQTSASPWKTLEMSRAQLG